MFDQPSVPSGPLTFDLPCLGCGYNLRGLSGDPVRCPECGRLNPLGDAEIPEELIQRELRKMETIPGLCVAYTLLMLPPAALFVATLVNEVSRTVPGRSLSPATCACFVAPELIFFGGWLASVYSFRKSCRGKPGWAAALWRYHLLGVGVGAAMLVGLVAVSMALWPPSRDPRLSYALTLIAGFSMCLLIVWRIAPRIYARVAERIRELQREEAAVRLRRRALRRAEAALRRR